MKNIFKGLVVILSVAFNGGLFAQEAPVPEETPDKTKMVQKMQSKMGDMTEEQKDQHLRAMQEHQLMLHELSDRIIAEQDPAKKQALKDQQFQMMKTYRVRILGHLQKIRDDRQ